MDLQRAVALNQAHPSESSHTDSMKSNAWHPGETLAPATHGVSAEAFDLALYERFDVSGPRYTSYPTADRFIEAFGPTEYEHWLEQRGTIGSRGAWGALSLYVHLPFCESVCYYCACNKVVTKRHERVTKYLVALEREVALVSGHLTGSRRVEQVHLGGGTPTFLNIAELESLVAMLKKNFEWSERGDYSIEIDPRTAPPKTIRALHRMGFNRISLGVQDFDATVQKAVNRVQPFDDTRRVVEAARECGFASINLDLIYGLPGQTTESFSRTLDQVISLDPDRIALYHYAHLPERFKPQRRIDAVMLPSREAKLAIMSNAIERFAQAGYTHIGMDHFAKPEDGLARAQREGRLHRNFQGYSTHADSDLVALGVSAIGKIGPTYMQNTRSLDEYYDALEAGRLPTARGIVLNADDLIRRAVIMALMCHFSVSKESIGAAYLVDFDSYFHEELAQLRELEKAHIVSLTNEWISVTPKGRFVVRNVAMIFDRYLQRGASQRRFSRIL